MSSSVVSSNTRDSVLVNAYHHRSGQEGPVTRTSSPRHRSNSRSRTAIVGSGDAGHHNHPSPRRKPTTTSSSGSRRSTVRSSALVGSAPLVATPDHKRGKRPLNLLPGFCCLQSQQPVTPTKSPVASAAVVERKQKQLQQHKQLQQPPRELVKKEKPPQLQQARNTSSPFSSAPPPLEPTPAALPLTISTLKNHHKNTTMPNIKGRVNEFLHRQLSFVGTAPVPNEEQQQHSLGVLQPRIKPRRSYSYKETTSSTTSSSGSRPSSGGKARQDTTTNSNSEPQQKSGCFINKYLNGQVKKQHPDIICGKTCYDLPVKEINHLSKRVVSAYTGPGKGLTCVNLKRKVTAFELPADAEVDFIDEDLEESLESLSLSQPVSSSPSKLINKLEKTTTTMTGKNLKQHLSSSSDDSDDSQYRPSSGDSYHSSATLPLSEDIAGVNNWFNPTDTAYGLSTTLYESHPSTHAKAGEPIADAFGICVRENSAIIALADGVNWGEKASLAAKCAVHGCIDYLNKALHHEGARVENTMDIFVCLLRSFSAAHNLILQEEGMLTTLTVAVVTQLKNSDRFIVCTCNVGDSLAYVYSKAHGVREITQGSHDIFSNRDMRDALGALGPVDGQNPELNNLTVAMTIVDQGDIVFLTSDGVSDNFDPVVGKFAMPRKKSVAGCEPMDSSKKSEQSNKTSSSSSKRTALNLRRANSNPDKNAALKVVAQSNNGLPTVSAEQRHDLTLLRMEDVLTNGLGGDSLQGCSSAKRLCDLMIEFASKLTIAKRRILEDPDLYNDEDEFGQADQRRRRRRVGEKLVMVPGKLDHASVVAYKVGFRGSLAGKNFEEGIKDEKKYNLKLKAALARFESNDDFSTFPDSPSPM